MASIKINTCIGGRAKEVMNEEEYISKRGDFLSKMSYYAHHGNAIFALVRQRSGDIFTNGVSELSIQDIRRREQNSGLYPPTPLHAEQSNSSVDNDDDLENVKTPSSSPQPELLPAGALRTCLSSAGTDNAVSKFFGNNEEASCTRGPPSARTKPQPGGKKRSTPVAKRNVDVLAAGAGAKTSRPTKILKLSLKSRPKKTLAPLFPVPAEEEEGEEENELEPEGTMPPTSPEYFDKVVQGTELPTNPKEAREAATARQEQLFKLRNPSFTKKGTARRKPRKTPDLLPEFFSPDNFSRQEKANGAVRCVCGATTDDNRQLVGCDDCGGWEHVACMGEGVPHDLKETGEGGYSCRVCDPWAHRVVLAKMRRGEKVGSAAAVLMCTAGAAE